MDTKRLIDRATVSLGLDRPLHPWWLGEAKPPRPVRRVPVLAAPCPLPSDLDPALLLGAFAAKERASISRQLDDAYRQLVVLPVRRDRRADADVIEVQLGVPLVTRSRALIRLCTRNFYGDGELVTGDFHAWLTPDGDALEATSPALDALAAAWPRWDVGRSPGLRALVDLNEATELQLLRVPGLNQPRARAIIASRPFTAVTELAAVDGIAPSGLQRLRDHVTV